MKNGVIQNWGLVEFFDSDSAEVTQSKVQGRILNGHKVRVSFCIPGVNAINIYMAVVNAKDDVKTKKALLEDAPSSSVYTQLQKLATQNPACKLIIAFMYSRSQVSVSSWWCCATCFLISWGQFYLCGKCSIETTFYREKIKMEMETEIRINYVCH